MLISSKNYNEKSILVTLRANLVAYIAFSMSHLFLQMIIYAYSYKIWD